MRGTQGDSLEVGMFSPDRGCAAQSDLIITLQPEFEQQSVQFRCGSSPAVDMSERPFQSESLRLN